MNKSIRVFISYAHEDEKDFKIPLDKSLIALKRSNKIEVWHDRMIRPGEEWDGSIKKELNESQLILMIISVDFLNSTYIWENELKLAIEKHHAGTAKVIPIIARACDWHEMPFSHLQCLPGNARPISEFPDKDEVFTQIARQIKEEVNGMLGLLVKGDMLPDEAAPAKSPAKKRGCSLTFSVVFVLLISLSIFYYRGMEEKPGMEMTSNAGSTSPHYGDGGLQDSLTGVTAALADSMAYAARQDSLRLAASNETTAKPVSAHPRPKQKEKEETMPTAPNPNSNQGNKR